MFQGQYLKSNPDKTSKNPIPFPPPHTKNKQINNELNKPNEKSPKKHRPPEAVVRHCGDLRGAPQLCIKEKRRWSKGEWWECGDEWGEKFWGMSFLWVFLEPIGSGQIIATSHDLTPKGR